MIQMPMIQIDESTRFLDLRILLAALLSHPRGRAMSCEAGERGPGQESQNSGRVVISMTSMHRNLAFLTLFKRMILYEK